MLSEREAQRERSTLLDALMRYAFLQILERTTTDSEGEAWFLEKASVLIDVSSCGCAYRRVSWAHARVVWCGECGAITQSVDK